ncbi:N-acetylmuramoyl-L-alanine amidase [Salegentibacter salegens]|nr:N-acetylmuramoyl-L-alanine amidase [Salegentibacter salegens]
MHCNHSDNPNARGIEVYVANGKSKYFEESTWLAYQLQAEFKDRLGFESRGVKFANFQVLRETQDYFPAVLLELGFLSNWDESCYFLKTDNIKATALAILMGLYNYFNI